MLRKKAVRKIIITTFSIVTIFVLCMIPKTFDDSENLLNLEIETTYVDNSTTSDIYLLGINDYLTKVSVFINGNTLNEKIDQIIKYLTIDGSSKVPDGLKAIIPKETKLNSFNVEDKIVTLDFNEKLFDIDKSLEERLIESITYSLININGIEGVKLKINGNDILELPKSNKKLPLILNRNYGINKVFDIDDIHNVNKVVLYYYSKIGEKEYYVPVTKYLNDDREKIKIIIENLSSNFVYESSLVSILNPNTELINYEIDDKLMKINFNQGIFMDNKVLEEVIYSIS